MSSRSIGLSESVYTYMLAHSLRESPACQALRTHTEKMAEGMMQISPEQGQFMALLVSLMGAQKALEVGTFTGYSALCVAQALPENGTLTACDIAPEWTAIGEKYWAQAGVRHKIDLRIAPALETLVTLAPQAGTFDFAFVDADKIHYVQYYQAIIPLLKDNGLLLIDNVLWSGSVADPNIQDPSTQESEELQNANNDALDVLSCFSAVSIQAFWRARRFASAVQNERETMRKKEKK